jgi:hypothetical protein
MMGNSMTEEMIRVLQMNDEDSDVRGKTVEEVQNEFFLDTLLKQDGIYRYRTQGSTSTEGTVMLFQFQSQIIASAMYLGEKRYKQPLEVEGDEYKGEFHFSPNTIQVFDPITEKEMKEVWSEFKIVRRFWQLPAGQYPAFLAKRRNVRPRSPLQADAADDDPDGYQGNNEDERSKITREISARRGAKKFRNSLLKRYGNQCLVTGCTIIDVLEAAHIHPHRGLKDDHPENGVLLRSDVHTLFDLYLLAIEPENMRVEVRPHLVSDPYYGQFHGKLLNTDAGPSKSELKVRYLEFKRLAAEQGEA